MKEKPTDHIGEFVDISRLSRRCLRRIFVGSFTSSGVPAYLLSKPDSPPSETPPPHVLLEMERADLALFLSKRLKTRHLMFSVWYESRIPMTHPMRVAFENEMPLVCSLSPKDFGRSELRLLARLLHEDGILSSRIPGDTWQRFKKRIKQPPLTNSLRRKEIFEALRISFPYLDSCRIFLYTCRD